MKKVFFCGGSHRRIKDFPKEAKDSAGHQLWLVQQGFDPLDWRPMASIGAGVKEIRVHEPHEHRVVYVAKFGDAVYVLHAFEKKTQSTPKKDIEIARAVSGVNMLKDCIMACKTSADFLSRNSENHMKSCAFCAEICKACAASCEAFGADKQMKDCAAECRTCATSCEKMAQMK